MIRNGFIFSLLFAGSFAAAQTSYNVQTLQYPQSFATYAAGINNSGVVVGTYYDQSGVQHGFEFYGKTYAAINIPGTISTWTSAVNDSGEYAGYYRSVIATQGYTLLNGKFVTIKDGSAEVQILGINNAGGLVGYTTPSLTSTTASGLAVVAGVPQTLNIPLAANTWISGINNRGEMVGYGGTPGGNIQACTIVNGKLTVFRYPGASQTVFYGLNDRGVIVGYQSNSSGTLSGFVYSGGVYTNFAVPNAQYTVPQAINNSGEIAGYYVQNGVTYGFLAVPN